uniref:Knottin scorpion toxin-like domain-containing protein n=1 Tax=Leersia perrieri TaxID=77586 RepID=A0A0D9XHZ7_9ORYZ
MACKIVIVVYMFVLALLFSHVSMALNEKCDNERAPGLTGCPGHFNCGKVCIMNRYKGGHCLDDGTDQPHCYCFTHCENEKEQFGRSKLLLEHA